MKKAKCLIALLTSVTCLTFCNTILFAADKTDANPKKLSFTVVNKTDTRFTFLFNNGEQNLILPVQEKSTVEPPSVNIGKISEPVYLSFIYMAKGSNGGKASTQPPLSFAIGESNNLNKVLEFEAGGKNYSANLTIEPARVNLVLGGKGKFDINLNEPESKDFKIIVESIKEIQK